MRRFVLVCSGKSAAYAGTLAEKCADISWSLAQKHHQTLSNDSSRDASCLAVTVESLRPDVQKIHRDVTEFVHELVIPLEKELRIHSEAETWTPHPKIEELKVRTGDRHVLTHFGQDLTQALAAQTHFNIGGSAGLGRAHILVLK